MSFVPFKLALDVYGIVSSLSRVWRLNMTSIGRLFDSVLQYCTYWGLKMHLPWQAAILPYDELFRRNKVNKPRVGKGRMWSFLSALTAFSLSTWRRILKCPKKELGYLAFISINHYVWSFFVCLFTSSYSYNEDIAICGWTCGVFQWSRRKLQEPTFRLLFTELGLSLINWHSDINEH